MKTGNFGRGASAGIFILCLLAAVSTVFSQTGRKPTLAVMEFEVRPQVTKQVGRELSDMLVNALLESQRFTVVDRSKTSEIQKEQIQVLLGAVDQATGAKVGKLTGAQYLLVGSVTEYKENKTGIGGGLSSIGINIPKSNKISSYQAIVKFNLKVINSTTGEISFSKAIEKDVKSAGLSDSNGVYGVGGNYESKAMQQAIEQGMKDAVAALVESIGAFTPASAAVTETSSSSTVDCSRITGANSPKIMVVIPETHISRKVPDPAGETEIIKRLVQQGFKVVDQKQVAVIRDREKVMAALRSPKAAAALGLEFGADIIIIGEAFSELAGRQGQMISTRARVEARAIQTDTAVIMAADGKEGSGMDVAELISGKTALRNAGSQWADYFITQVCQSKDSNVAKNSSVEILVSNINYPQLTQFTDALKKIQGVRSMEKKFTAGVGRVVVQYDGTADELADRISETKFAFRVIINGLSGNKIELGVTGSTR